MKPLLENHVKLHLDMQNTLLLSLPKRWESKDTLRNFILLGKSVYLDLLSVCFCGFCSKEK